MNRTLTAAAALTAAHGTAGLAHAQSSTMQPTSPSTGMTAPSGTQNPATAPGPTSTYGAQSPQASTQMGQPQGAQQVAQPQVQQAQQQLKSAGLYSGAVDGVMGPETQTALSRFQREQGLPQTAQLDQQTLDRLNGSNPGANRPTGQTNTR
jgi:peptidoglycan hydrolase-like protein with peptidoglycan-binding domain